jgi:hypothetical protein
MASQNDYPAIQNEAPWADTVTEYDRAHFTSYVRLLDAVAAHASDDEMCRMILGIDYGQDPTRAKRVLDSHLKRARWMTEQGFRQLLQ